LHAQILKRTQQVTITPVDIGTLITRSPEIRGNRPRIAGTGVTVQRIVGWYKLGLNPEEIAAEIGHLTLAQVYAALAYYHANRDEIETAIEAEEREGDALEQGNDQIVKGDPANTG
jgi:uncharacterized protein (DUF433 family)